MTFWSDKTLRANLDQVIDPPDPAKVDVSGYRLSVGEKAYVTRDLEQNTNPECVDSKLSGCIEIPPGQFALISTKEKITVPKNAIGFISIRAKIKFKGLINVSGFHVDPGYSDHLIFSVFNAGPKPIPIQSGDDIFLIWFANLDKQNSASKSPGNLRGNIPSEFIGEINLQVNSTAALSAKFEQHRRDFVDIGNRFSSIETFKSRFDSAEKLYQWVLPIASAIFLAAVALANWGVSNVYDLRIKSELQSDREKELGSAIEKLRAEYKSLAVNVDILKSFDAQSQKIVIETIDERLRKIERDLSDLKR